MEAAGVAVEEGKRLVARAVESAVGSAALTRSLDR